MALVVVFILFIVVLFGFTAIIMQAKKASPDLALRVPLQRAPTQLTPEALGRRPGLAVCLHVHVED